MSASGNGDGNGSNAEIARLARVAQHVNIGAAVAELQGEFIQFFDRETRAYMAQAGDAWSDNGLAAWIKEREAEMQRTWRADIDDLQRG